MSRIGALLVVTALVAAGGAAAQEDGKRAPKGFLGMRGKKDDDAFDKRAPILGFQGVRGKKDGDVDLQELDALDKRAPIRGFQGVRGKKNDDDTYDKRAPIRGFQGVRGKKDGEDVDEGEPGDYLQQLTGFPYQEQDYVEEGDGEDGLLWSGDDKRAPKGFLGMRGKKTALSGFYGVRGKKGPSGFYGVRGKKAPLSGFYGVRGKKAPILGFQGVRGKKDEAQQDLDSLLYYLSDGGAAVRQKRGNTKTVPSGFIGTRGKKSWEGEAVQARDMIDSAPVNIQQK